MIRHAVWFVCIRALIRVCAFLHVQAKAARQSGQQERKAKQEANATKTRSMPKKNDPAPAPEVVRLVPAPRDDVPPAPTAPAELLWKFPADSLTETTQILRNRLEKLVPKEYKTANLADYVSSSPLTIFDAMLAHTRAEKKRQM